MQQKLEKYCFKPMQITIKYSAMQKPLKSISAMLLKKIGETLKLNTQNENLYPNATNLI